MISPVLPSYNRSKLSFVKGEGAWMIEADGRRQKTEVLLNRYLKEVLPDEAKTRLAPGTNLLHLIVIFPF